MKKSLPQHVLLTCAGMQHLTGLIIQGQNVQATAAAIVLQHAVVLQTHAMQSAHIAML